MQDRASICTFSGIVVHGHQHGRDLGYPTINIAIDDLVVEGGVYTFGVEIEGKTFGGMASVMMQRGLFEGHVFDFDGDLYGQVVRVFLYEKIRDNQQFGSMYALQQQLCLDEKKARDLLSLDQ